MRLSITRDAADELDWTLDWTAELRVEPVAKSGSKKKHVIEYFQ